MFIVYFLHWALRKQSSYNPNLVQLPRMQSLLRKSWLSISQSQVILFWLQTLVFLFKCYIYPLFKYIICCKILEIILYFHPFEILALQGTGNPSHSYLAYLRPNTINPYAGLCQPHQRTQHRRSLLGRLKETVILGSS